MLVMTLVTVGVVYSSLFPCWRLLCVLAMTLMTVGVV